LRPNAETADVICISLVSSGGSARQQSASGLMAFDISVRAKSLGMSRSLLKFAERTLLFKSYAASAI
jgi:hypothetical protein